MLLTLYFSLSKKSENFFHHCYQVSDEHKAMERPTWSRAVVKSMLCACVTTTTSETTHNPAEISTMTTTLTLTQTVLQSLFQRCFTSSHKHDVVVSAASLGFSHVNVTEQKSTPPTWTWHIFGIEGHRESVCLWTTEDILFKVPALCKNVTSITLKQQLKPVHSVRKTQHVKVLMIFIYRKREEANNLLEFQFPHETLKITMSSLVLQNYVNYSTMITAFWQWSE